jgi:hypothetical protein
MLPANHTASLFQLLQTSNLLQDPITKNIVLQTQPAAFFRLECETEINLLMERLNTHPASTIIR